RRRRTAHAVLQGISSTVLFANDGRDGDCGIAGGHGDGDARRRREPGDRVDHAGGDGKGIAVRDPRRRPHGGRGHDRGDYYVASCVETGELRSAGTTEAAAPTRA